MTRSLATFKSALNLSEIGKKSKKNMGEWRRKRGWNAPSKEI
jgi:hypothetical protein